MLLLNRCLAPIEKLVIFNNDTNLIEPNELSFDEFKKLGWVCNRDHTISDQELKVMTDAIDDWWAKTSAIYDRKLLVLCTLK